MLKELSDDLELLWVAGLALLQLGLGSRFLPFTGEAYEWAQYLLLGTLFPTLLFGLLVAGRNLRSSPAARFGKLALAGLCIAGSVVLSVQRFQPLVLWIAAFQFALFVGVTVFSHRFASGSRTGGPRLPGPWLGVRPHGIVLGAGVMALGWLVAVRFLHWVALGDWLSTWQRWSTLAAYGALTATALAGARGVREPTGFRLLAWSDVPALLILALASFRPIDLDPPRSFVAHIAYHHWGALVGPAEMVRQGGWLLWDVPSQYGFLNTLLVAAFPVGDVWQSFYVVNALLTFGTAGFLFLLLRSLRPGLVTYAFALLVTLAAVFLIPGAVSCLTGPFMTPAVGAFRFFWCSALLAVLTWAFLDGLRGAWSRTVLWVGCGAWVLGTLWSSESAAYSAAIWLPAYVFLVARRVRASTPATEPPLKRFLAAGLWLLLPLACLGVTVAGISVSYLRGVGHLPDWYCFCEYSCALGAFALPMDPNGCVGWLLLILFAIATTAVFCARGDDPLGHAALLWGAGASLWAAASYFVGRSHEVNATNLSPVIATSMAVTLLALSRRQTTSCWPMLIRLGFVPVLTLFLTVTFGSFVWPWETLQTALKGYRAHVERLLPEADPSLQQLLDQARVRADDPLLFIDPTPLGNHCPTFLVADGAGHRRLTAQRTWLPVTPLALYMPLPSDRGCCYLSRFVERTHRSGWLIQANDNKTDPRWVFEQVGKTHEARSTLANANWRITWFEYKDAE